MILQKTKRMSLHEFLNGDSNKKVSKVNTNIFRTTSFSTFIVSPSALLNPPEYILHGYLIVIGVGAFAISCAVLEKCLVGNQLTHLAKVVFNFVEVLLPWLLVGALVLFVYKNPLL